MRREKYYDVIKGFAIWLVVLGHCWQTFCPGWENTILAKIIIMFHMPLFIAVSGYFFLSSVCKYSLKDNIKRKFLRLYLPSFSWGLISVIIFLFYKLICHKELEILYFISLLFTGMWFLTVLFLISIIGVFIQNYYSKYKYCAWLIIYLIINFLPSYGTFNQLKYLIPYFVLAMYFSKYNWRQCPLWLFSISLLIFILLLNIYTFDYSLYQMGGQNVLTFEYYWKSFIRFFSGISGVICSLYICKWIYQLKKVNYCFMYIGTLTLPIYVLHQYFLLIQRVSSYQNSSILFNILLSIVIVLISILSYKILNKKYIRIFLFGENK